MPRLELFLRVTLAFSMTACAVAPIAPPDTRTSENASASRAEPSSPSTVRLSGRIRTGSTGELPALRVTARPAHAEPSAPTWQTWTDTSGSFVLNLPDGVYNLAVDGAPGYRALKFDVQAATSVDVDLVPTGRLSGRIKAPAGVPLEGLVIYVPGTDLVARADAEGRFTMRDVPVGSYTLVAGLPGAPALRLGPVDVPAGQERVLPDATLLPPELAITSVSSDVIGPGGFVTIRGKGFTPAMRIYDSTGRRIFDWRLLDPTSIEVRIPVTTDVDDLEFILETEAATARTDSIVILRPVAGQLPFRLAAGQPRWVDGPPMGIPLPPDVGLVGKPFPGAVVEPAIEDVDIELLQRVTFHWYQIAPTPGFTGFTIDGLRAVVTATKPGTFVLMASTGTTAATRSVTFAQVTGLTDLLPDDTVLPEAASEPYASSPASGSTTDLFPGEDEPVDGTGGGEVLGSGTAGTSPGLPLAATVLTSMGTRSAVVWQSLNPAVASVNLVEGTWVARSVGTVAGTAVLKVSSWDDPEVWATRSVRIQPAGGLTIEVK